MHLFIYFIVRFVSCPPPIHLPSVRCYHEGVDTYLFYRGVQLQHRRAYLFHIERPCSPRLLCVLNTETHFILVTQN